MPYTGNLIFPTRDCRRYLSKIYVPHLGEIYTPVAVQRDVTKATITDPLRHLTDIGRFNNAVPPGDWSIDLALVLNSPLVQVLNFGTSIALHQPWLVAGSMLARDLRTRIK